MSAPVEDERAAPRGRRRSERSHAAIVDATQELLSEGGYRKLTIEAVAARAGVGKQTIYRWWPSRAALVLEAYLTGSEAIAAPAQHDAVSEDVRALLVWLSTVLAQPIGGRILAGLIADMQHDHDLAQGFRSEVVPARRSRMLAALERGRDRGEIRADADLEVAVDALHGAVFYRLLLSGAPLDEAFATRVANHVLDGLAPRAVTTGGVW
jgi:AcrR family transcriptional regulator